MFLYGYGRRILIGLAAVIAAVAVVIVIAPEAYWLAIVVAACALAMVVVLNVLRPPHERIPPGLEEPDEMSDIAPDRQRELMRGTSLFLRDMGYRYSVRPDAISDALDRKPFTAEVNTVRLGFVPAIITDNTTDREGLGYVAFVYDGKRWRGPGLPCPGGHSEAVRHAARCVSPLATDEETGF